MIPSVITEALEKLAAARNDFVAKRVAMNAARCPIGATSAERALYDERYQADHAAERELWTRAIEFSTLVGTYDFNLVLETLTGECERYKVALQKIKAFNTAGDCMFKVQRAVSIATAALSNGSEEHD